MGLEVLQCTLKVLGFSGVVGKTAARPRVSGAPEVQAQDGVAFFEPALRRLKHVGAGIASAESVDEYDERTLPGRGDRVGSRQGGDQRVSRSVGHGEFQRFVPGPG